MTIISGTILHYCCLKYAKISTSFPVIRSSYFLKFAQIAANGVSGVYISKIFRGACSRTPLGCLTPSALVCMTTHTTLASPLATSCACICTNKQGFSHKMKFGYVHTIGKIRCRILVILIKRYRNLILHKLSYNTSSLFATDKE